MGPSHPHAGAYISSGSPSFDATAVVPRITPEGSDASANSLAFRLSLSRTQWFAAVMTMLRAMVRIADGGPLATCSTWQYTPIGKEPACERGRATRGPVCCAAASTSRPLAPIGSPTSSRKRKPSRKVVPTVRPPWDPDDAAIALESSDRTTCATRPFEAGRPEFSWPYRAASAWSERHARNPLCVVPPSGPPLTRRTQRTSSRASSSRIWLPPVARMRTSGGSSSRSSSALASAFVKRLAACVAN
eukprot:scaffold20316_cov66-Phaeocystis_antarctica.AAC.2